MGTRILHLVGGLRAGGKERVVVELARAGRAAGHDDRIALFEESPAGSADGFLEADGIPVHPDAVGGGTLRRARRLTRLLRELRPAALHAHNDSALVLSSLASAPMGMRRITTLHNMPVAPARRHRLMVRALAGRQDTVACVSDELRARRVAGGWISAAEVVPNGVDLERFSPSGTAVEFRPRLGVDPDTAVLGMVARLDVGKRHGDVIRAAARCGRAVAVVLLGDGPRRDEVLGLGRGRVPLLHLPHVADVPAALRGLDLVALASDHEGLPMSLLEAMACGRPVVASAVGGVPELLGDVGAPGLVPAGDVDAFARALGELLHGPRAAALGEALRRRAAESFSLRDSLLAYERLALLES